MNGEEGRGEGRNRARGMAYVKRVGEKSEDEE